MKNFLKKTSILALIISPFVSHLAFAQTAPIQKPQNNWNLNETDFNQLYDWDLVEKAGGCKRTSEYVDAAKKNDAVANLLAGICHRRGLNATYSTKMAREYYKKASDLGLAYALSLIHI